MTHPPIRRQERAVTDAQQIEAILQKCTCCRLGFNDNGEIYIVPLNFGYRWADGTCTLYFHGAPEGRKAALLKDRPHVGFELDCGYALQSAETACGYSARYQSIIGTGRAKPVEDPEEKLLGLTLLMEHTAGAGDWTFSPEALQQTFVFKVLVDTLSCKEHT